MTSLLAGWPSMAMAADTTGTWLTEDGRARIRTERCGPDESQLCGYVVWASPSPDDKDGPDLDHANPDPQKKLRPLLGHQMLMGLRLNEKGRFEGKIYSGEDGKSYNVTVWSEKPAELVVKGCMLAFLCKSQSWTRVIDVKPGQLQGPTNGAGGPRSDSEWAPKPRATIGIAPGQNAKPPVPR